MAEPITTTDLLNFLVKAHKVSSNVNVSFKKEREEYVISIYCDWHDDDNFYTQTTYITEEGESTWESSDYEFFTMNNLLGTLVQKEEERKIKKQKRQELISRLTDEEKELLGLK